MSAPLDLDASAARLLVLACSDHHCDVARRSGMGTNGGCNCISRIVPVDERVRLREVLRHGDCIGWDEQAHALAPDVGLLVEMHPPRNATKRAYCRMLPGETTHPPLEYLARNRAIVDATSVLIACPKEEHFEELRSGTWATVRYARKFGRPIYIVRPSGRIEQERAR